MTESRFLDLCQQASASLGVPDTEQLGRDGRITVDDVLLLVFFDELVTPDQLRCYADLGPIDAHDEAAQLRRLLGFNLFSGHPSQGMCAVDPASGHGLYVTTLWTSEDTDGRQLAASLRWVVSQATTIRAELRGGPAAAEHPLLAGAAA